MTALKKAAAANARLHVSLLARPAVVLLIRSAKTKLKASDFVKMDGLAHTLCDSLFSRNKRNKGDIQ